MRLHLYVRAILVKNLKSLIFIYKLKILKKKNRVKYSFVKNLLIKNLLIKNKLNKIQIFEK